MARVVFRNGKSQDDLDSWNDLEEVLGAGARE